MLNLTEKMSQINFIDKEFLIIIIHIKNNKKIHIAKGIILLLNYKNN